jgi:hypothetical protein
MAIEALAPRRELFPRCTPLINLTSAGHETHDGHLAHLRPWAWNATNRPKPALARLLRLKSQTNRIQTRQETTNIGGVPYPDSASFFIFTSIRSRSSWSNDKLLNSCKRYRIRETTRKYAASISSGVPWTLVGSSYGQWASIG